MKDPKVIQAFENMGAIVDFRYGEDWIKDMKVTYDIMKYAAEYMKN
jgi:hypothetical protein